VSESSYSVKMPHRGRDSQYLVTEPCDTRKALRVSAHFQPGEFSLSRLIDRADQDGHSSVMRALAIGEDARLDSGPGDSSFDQGVTNGGNSLVA